MNNFDLPETAHNICAIANYKLAKIPINITHKWILVNEEDGRKNMTLSSVELINRQFKDEMQRVLMKQRILRKGCDSQEIFSVCG